MNDAADKVRKLLRLAQSSNPHEADLALARAMDIAARHQIDVSSLADDDETARLVARYFRCGGKRLAREWREALSVVRGFFNVSTCVMCGQGRVAFIGTESDVQIADYVTSFLVRRCRDALREFIAAEARAKRRATGNKRASFINAFFGGVWATLRSARADQIEQITGLELALKDAGEKRRAFMQAEIGETSQMNALAKPRRDLATLVAGYHAGLAVEINPALGADQPLALPSSS